MKAKKKHQAELEQKRALRAFRQFAAGHVTDMYLEDKCCLHGDDILDAFIIEQVGSNMRRGTGILRKLLISNVKKATKDSIRAALQDGVPGVLVTEEYFEIDDDERAEIMLDEKDAKKYVAGIGPGAETAGVHFSSNESVDGFWIAQFNHRLKVTNGVVDRTKSEADAAHKQRLAGFSGNKKVMRQLNVMPKLEQIASN